MPKTQKFRLLPQQDYTIARLDYHPDAIRCQNCRQRIHWAATVGGHQQPGPWSVGLDCAETMLGAEVGAWREKAKEVTDVRHWLNKWEKKHTEMPGLRLPTVQVWPGVLLLRVPYDFYHDYLARRQWVSIADWFAFWHPIVEKLRECGVEVPAIAPEAAVATPFHPSTELLAREYALKNDEVVERVDMTTWWDKRYYNARRRRHEERVSLTVTPQGQLILWISNPDGDNPRSFYAILPDEVAFHAWMEGKCTRQQPNAKQPKEGRRRG